MTSRQMRPSEATLVPLFLGEPGCNITYVLDTSESMRAVLESVKRLLSQILLAKGSERDSLFNIVTFSSKVHCWSHHMLSCFPDTVITALSWLHLACCSPGRNLLAALSLALTDPACHTVHLLCAGLPEQPEVVLKVLPALAAGKSVDVFYLQESGSQMETYTRDYMQCLTQATRGNCYLITFDLNGTLEKVIPLYAPESQSAVPTVSQTKSWCSPTPTIPPLPLRCSLGSQPCSATSCTLCCQTEANPKFFPGCRVLARREADGLYYQGTLLQQVKGSRGVWVIEFDYPGSVNVASISSLRQVVCSLDMVNDSKAQNNRLVPGDVVLSPWEPDPKRYGPGRVMASTECRADSVTNLRVLMWNGCMSLVPDSLVWPISTYRYDRLVRELQAPSSAPSPCCSWLSTYKSSIFPRLSFINRSQSAFTSCCCLVTNNLPCLVSPHCRSNLGEMEGFDSTEHRQVDLRDTDSGKSDSEAPSSSSSSPSVDETRVSISPAGKLKSKQKRPPWRYWRRIGPEPQHRQPGSTVPRISQPASFPAPETITSPNHNSLFLSLPGTKGRMANIRDVFGPNSYKPQPPAGLQPFSGSTASAHT